MRHSFSLPRLNNEYGNENNDKNYDETGDYEQQTILKPQAFLELQCVAGEGRGRLGSIRVPLDRFQFTLDGQRVLVYAQKAEHPPQHRCLGCGLAQCAVVTVSARTVGSCR